MSATFASGDYVQYAMQQPPPTTRGCIAIRFRTTQNSGNIVPFSRVGPSSSNQGIQFTLTGSTGTMTVYAKYNTSSTAFDAITPTGGYNDGNWHTVACNFEQGSSKPFSFYADGSLITSGTSNVNSWTIVSGTTRIGKSIDTFWNNFVGDLADVVWFDENLTAEEIAAYHKGFSPMSIKPSNVELYIPLIRSVNTLTGQATSAQVGVSASAHPRVFG